MPQDISPYVFAHDVWDLHRDGLRFAKEQLEAWEDGSQYWMTVWEPDDPTHMDCAHAMVVQNPDTGLYEGVRWPIVFVTDGAEELVDDIDAEYQEIWTAFPSIIGWGDDPMRATYGIDAEFPDYVRLWGAWPLTLEEAKVVDRATMGEYEGGLYGALQHWYQLAYEWGGSLEDLEEYITRPPDPRDPPRAQRRSAEDRTYAEQAYEELQDLAEVLDLDERGEPIAHWKQLQVGLPDELDRTWRRLNGSLDRAHRYLEGKLSSSDLYREEHISLWP